MGRQRAVAGTGGPAVLVHLHDIPSIQPAILDRHRLLGIPVVFRDVLRPSHEQLTDPRRSDHFYGTNGAIGIHTDYTHLPEISGLADAVPFLVGIQRAVISGRVGAIFRHPVGVEALASHPSPDPVHEAFGETEKQAVRVLAKWKDEGPRITAGSDLIEHVYEKSIIDLAALRLTAAVAGNDYSLPAAGLPWFMAIFGRDTLITSYQSLWGGPDLAKGARHALAALQGTEMNDFKDEEPGKILHEIRFGELTALGLKPPRPYYGTSDATPLWLILLSEYWRFSGDAETVNALRDNAMRALEWIDRFGDLDGDGYVEYRTRSSQGLGNQGWKDSWNGVAHADGSHALASSVRR